MNLKTFCIFFFPHLLSVFFLRPNNTLSFKSYLTLLFIKKIRLLLNLLLSPKLILIKILLQKLFWQHRNMENGTAIFHKLKQNISFHLRIFKLFIRRINLIALFGNQEILFIFDMCFHTMATCILLIRAFLTSHIHLM